MVTLSGAVVLLATVSGRGGVETGADVALEGRNGVGEGVNGVDDELDLRVLLVAQMGQPQSGRADGNVAVLERRLLLVDAADRVRLRLEVVRQEAAVNLLPIVAVPRIPLVVLRSQRQHVVVESRNAFRLEIHREGAFGHVLQTFHQLVLASPAVAGHPNEVGSDGQPFGSS